MFDRNKAFNNRDTVSGCRWDGKNSLRSEGVFANETAVAIRIAGETGMILIAFARGSRHTVYAHPGRVAADRKRVAV